MEIITKPQDMQKRAQEIKKKEKTIALVPTMGAFHEGHLSLMRRGKKEADVLIVSFFVNPTQFGPNEDFEKYPRDFECDIKLAEEIQVDILFAPEPKDVYPSNYKTFVTVEDLSKKLCGLSRPIHFRGVATVVLKLFNLTMPDVAIFGWKDAQQFLILKQMVEDLNVPVKMIAVPIVRENDGLAMSSRNIYLSQKERKNALSLFKALNIAADLIKNGEKNTEKIRKIIEETILDAPLAKIDYIKIVSKKSLDDIQKIEEGNTLIALAAHLGETRLIDNIRI